uniref:Secreted protein n=1 Tax=Steinernema glaseri TaxID=37863 RepID=A0A1I7ZZD2_9BILA
MFGPLAVVCSFARKTLSAGLVITARQRHQKNSFLLGQSGVLFIIERSVVLLESFTWNLQSGKELKRRVKGFLNSGSLKQDRILRRPRISSSLESSEDTYLTLLLPTLHLKAHVAFHVDSQNRTLPGDSARLLSADSWRSRESGAGSLLCYKCQVLCSNRLGPPPTSLPRQENRRSAVVDLIGVLQEVTYMMTCKTLRASPFLHVLLDLLDLSQNSLEFGLKLWGSLLHGPGDLVSSHLPRHIPRSLSPKSLKKQKINTE